MKIPATSKTTNKIDVIRASREIDCTINVAPARDERIIKAASNKYKARTAPKIPPMM
jgi:hypothetical protein